jgi:transcriptional regulator with XRE-family HTH domain
MSDSKIDALNTRIIEIMVNKNHSKSSFAKALDVSLPLITHITSGRNKPGIELIQKVLSIFPDINPDWLLLGYGNIYRNVLKMPDFSDIQADIEQLRTRLSDTSTQLNTIKQYHKILIDELLHLQEADLELNSIQHTLTEVTRKMQTMKQNIEYKVSVE